MLSALVGLLIIVIVFLAAGLAAKRNTEPSHVFPPPRREPIAWRVRRGRWADRGPVFIGGEYMTYAQAEVEAHMARNAEEAPGARIAVVPVYE